jgi:signal peptidase I
VVEVSPEQSASNRRRQVLRSLLEIPLIVLISFALVFGFVRPVVAESRYVGSGSMIPTLRVYDRVLVNKLAYDFGNAPERGDIVLFESVDGGPDPLIKRVVGLPGDEIEVRKDTLYINGKAQNEPYTNDRLLKFQGPYGPTKVPRDHYFMMGDNRGNSADSRVFGPVPEENLIGEAFLRFWPLDRMGTLPD